MRIFELLLLLVCTTLPFLLSRINNKLKPFLIITTLLLVFTHTLLEGYRWQMIPAYLIIVICLVFVYQGKVFFNEGVLKKLAVGFFFFLFLGIAWILPNILPVFNLPEPTGTYDVGSQDIHIKTELDEIITENPIDKRELMIKAWFPATVKDEKRESYLNRADRQGFALKYGLPEKSFNYLELIETHTFKNAEVAAGEFPVLLFSHGQYSIASGYYAIIEEIVSHGYIVLVINHTYESIGTEFTDGNIKYFNQEYDKKKLTQEMADLAWKSNQDFQNANNEIEKRAIAEKLILNYYATEITQRWARDIETVINELQDWNSKTFLTNHLDLDNIGVFGHSQGGAAVGQAMVQNKKIMAGLNIDGVQWGSVINDTIRQPFALLSSDWPESHPDFNSQIYRKNNMSNYTGLQLQRSGHASFMDIPYMIDLKALNESGSIDAVRASEITSKVILQFFDTYLKGQKEFDVEQLTGEYPELITQ